MKKNRGAVLTGIILMVLVMTLIGVPLLGMVVYNYRLVELSNSLKRSEYENEMAMDIISVIVRETVIEAISDAKEDATSGVNELVELQRTNYSSVYGKYTSLWINEYNLWENKVLPDMEILGGFIARIKMEAGSEDETYIRNWWKGLSGTERESIKESEKKTYVSKMVEDELKAIESDKLDDTENDSIEMLLKSDTGLIDEEQLNNAYNMIFKGRYQESIKSKIIPNILTDSRYIGIVSDEGIIDTSGSEDLPASDNYLKISNPTVRAGDKIEVDTGTRFKKNKTTPLTTLTATFIISTPEFDSVSSVTQESITLSNALLNQGGVIVGGKLNLAQNTKLQMANDLTVLGEGGETAIELKKGSSLEALKLAEDGLSLTTSNSRISTSKDIILNDGSTLKTGANPIYYRNLYVGKPGVNDNTGTINVEFIGDAVAEDDLEINYEGTVKIHQSNDESVKIANYYGFNDTNNKGPDSSSSIVINSKELSNKEISLGNLYLAGRAFIEDVKGTENTPIYAEDGVTIEGYADTTYKTGESIAIKGNYIAYQTPLFSDNPEVNYDFSPDKVKFSTYFLKRDETSEKQHATINLADGFIIKPTDSEGKSFDVNYKWKYFRDYAEKYGSILKSISVTSRIRYIEGVAFDNLGKIVNSSNETITDTSFRNNLAIEYEKYTKYFGYRPIDDTGKVDGTKAKTSIFGTNGWIKPFSNLDKSSDIEGGKYYQIYTNGDKTVQLSGDINKGIIVCKGNLTIDVTSEATFNGVIIVGGDLNINGGKLILKEGKEEVINTVIGNYLGDNKGTTGETSELYDTFTYDGSGSTYIVTRIGDNLININDLIGITNWKKSSYGRL